MTAPKLETAIVVGATGITGRAIAQKLEATGHFRVFCISRSGISPIKHGIGLSVDCLDEEACRRAFTSVGPVSHLFYSAYQAQPTRGEEVRPNLGMLTNVLKAAEQYGALHHVVLITGAKYYGIQWGSGKTPMRESDQRHLGPNFYYEQEDFLSLAQRNASWTWTNLIPPFIAGYAVGNPMNLVLAIGVFGALSRLMNCPLRFPGTQAAYEALHQIADVDLVADAALWACSTQAAGNQTFNLANGDPSRWCNFWPRLARHFGIEAAQPKTLPLQSIVSSYSDLWNTAIHRYNLASPPLERLVNWKWADYMFSMGHDVLLEIGKIRRAGFSECLDTEEAFLKRLNQLEANRIIPVL